MNDQSILYFSGELYNRCDVEPTCACTKGRKYSLPGSRFEIIRCANCGSSGVHIFCGKLERKAPFYICDQHEDAKKEMKDFSIKAMKKIRQENLDADDESPIDDKHLIKPGFLENPVSKTAKPSSSLNKPKPGPASKTRVTAKKKRVANKPTSRPSSSAAQHPPPIKRPHVFSIDSDSEPEDTPPQSSGLPKRPSMTSSENVPTWSQSASTSCNVTMPFRLYDPVTQDSTIMPVGPIAFSYELTPSLEGLNVQLEERLRRPRPQEPISDLSHTRPNVSSQNEGSNLPKISSQFTLQGIVSDNEFVVDLCDSD